MKNRVLLFFPSYRSLEAAPPLALLALASALEEQGYSVDVVDSTVEPHYRTRILDQLDESLFLGISIVTGPMIYEAIEIAKAVKARKPDFPVVMGGWHPSTRAVQTLRAPYVDAVVRGQGEVTLCEIANRLSEERDLSGVRGCSFKASDGRLVENHPRSTVDIETLPPKAYHLIDLDIYSRLCGRRWLMYTSSHGCPYDCSFCSNASLYGRAWNALAAPRVVAEVVELVRNYRLDLVDIVDDNFLVDRQRGIDIARGFLASGEKFEWCIQSTANFLLKMSDEDVQLMQHSGLDRVFIGAESGSDDMLRSANKVHFQPQRVLFDVAEKLSHAGITCTFSLIFALPGETDSDRKATLSMMREIKSRFPNTEFHSNIYTPNPGAPNFQQAVGLGLREPGSLEEWAEFYPKFQRLPWLNENEHKHIQRMREYIRIAFGTKRIRRSSSREKIVRLLGPAARARLRAGRYALPVELWLLKSAARLRAALTPTRARSHVLQP